MPAGVPRRPSVLSEHNYSPESKRMFSLRLTHQGNGILLGAGQDQHGVVFAPARAQALALDASFGRLFLPQQVERQMPRHREVLGGMALPEAAGIFIEADAQAPMHLVLDPPMAADCGLDLLRLARQTADPCTARKCGV